MIDATYFFSKSSVDYVGAQLKLSINYDRRKMIFFKSLRASVMHRIVHENQFYMDLVDEKCVHTRLMQISKS